MVALSILLQAAWFFGPRRDVQTARSCLSWWVIPTMISLGRSCGVTSSPRVCVQNGALGTPCWERGRVPVSERGSPRTQLAGPGGPAKERGWESQPPAVWSAVSEPLAAGRLGRTPVVPDHRPPCSRGCAIPEENLGAHVFQMTRPLLSPSLHFLASLLVGIVQEEGTECDHQNRVWYLVQKTSAAVCWLRPRSWCGSCGSGAAVLPGQLHSCAAAGPCWQAAVSYGRASRDAAGRSCSRLLGSQRPREPAGFWS